MNTITEIVLPLILLVVIGSLTVVNCRYLKPYDEFVQVDYSPAALADRLARETKVEIMPSGVGVVEFRSTEQYSDWLQRNGDQLTIISVNTTKRWSIWTGFLGGAKTITVTYNSNPIVTIV